MPKIPEVLIKIDVALLPIVAFLGFTTGIVGGITMHVNSVVRPFIRFFRAQYWVETQGTADSQLLYSSITDTCLVKYWYVVHGKNLTGNRPNLQRKVLRTTVSLP